MLVLLPFSMGAQEVDQSVEKRIDSLATEVTTLDKVVQKLSKFKVSAYIQGQYQYGQEDATLKVGDKNENLDKGFNRIGIRRGRMKFEYNDGIGTGAVQIEVNDKGVSFRDLYIGIKRAMEFPMMTTTVMPCSVAVFTIGLLLAFSRRVNLLVILFLCHWALIAFSKVYIYKIPEDLLLASATVPAIYLFFKNYFEQNLHKETKLGARLMNWFLILICIVVGVLLSMTLLHGMRG